MKWLKVWCSSAVARWPSSSSAGPLVAGGPATTRSSYNDKENAG